MKERTLVKMANQIAASVPDQANAAQQTATHLTAFWTPAMIDTLSRHAAGHPTDVSETVREALAWLRPA